MARVISFHGPSYYECDFCQDSTNRVLTDSYTNKDICLNCASYGEHGLFYTVTQEPATDGDNLIAVATEADLINKDDDEDEELCIYCGLEVTDDGVVLIDSTGGDACGMPLDDGNGSHMHCRAFAPDVWGSDPEVCAECHVHHELHPEGAAA